MPLVTVQSFLERMQTTPAQYDYSYFYQVYGLRQKRKIE